MNVKKTIHNLSLRNDTRSPYFWTVIIHWQQSVYY